ncbi:MAG: polysaccharide biosynthesis tyrosine autokinase [Cyanobacteria bacterium P01_C01_bin.72]
MTSNVHLDEYLDFQKYWQVLKRRWVPALVTFASVVGVATVGSFLSPEKYEAEAELLIESDNTSKITGLEDDLGKIEGLTIDSNPVTTQARIIQSRPIVNQLVKELDLRDQKGKLLKYQDITENLKIKPIVGTDVLQIRYISKNPEIAAETVNKLVDLYIEADAVNNSSSSSAARGFITKQLPQVEANLREAEANLREFKSKNRIASLEEETTANITSITSVAERLDEVKAQLENINARYEHLSAQLNLTWQEASAVSALSQSVGVQTVLEQLQNVKVRLTRTSNYLSDNAPQVIALKEEEADLNRLLEQQIASTMGSSSTDVLQKVNVLGLGELKQAQIAELANLGLQREGLEEEMVALTNTRDAYQEKSDALPRLQEEQRELERRVEAAQSTYETLLKRSQDTSIIEQQKIGNVRRVSDAEVPEDPVAPRRKIIVASAGILGMFLGVAVAFLLDIRDRTIKDTQEIKRLFPYNLAGVVPDLNSIDQERQLLLPHHAIGKLPEFAVANMTVMPIKEAYHNLQMDLNLLDSELAHKVIVVTSAVAGEGKSSVSANLAVAQAQCGKKVLLIDGDLRRPTQHLLWELPNIVGLTGVLEQEVAWGDVTSKIMPNLEVMTAGNIPKHPIALLNSSMMKALILSTSDRYDSIIIDAPPIVGLADSKILGKLADGLLFVVRPGVANYGSAEAAKELLQDFNVLGVIANGVDLNNESYGYESYYPDRKYLEAAN